MSIIPDKIPEPHNMNIVAAVRLPFVSSINLSAKKLIPPFASNPPMIMNKPTKKNIVSHSTSLYISFGFSNKSRKDAPATANA